jgi:cytoskeletal protein CcmA (bactofilin family)
MRTIFRTIVVLALAVLAVTVAAAPAAAQNDDEPDNIVVLTGRAEVREGETVDNVVIADGPVVVDGTVRDALIAVNGDVLIRGTVQEDVVAVDGRVTIADGGRVEGDVVGRRRPTVEAGGQLDGSWERWNPRAWSGAASIAGWLGLWLAVSVSTLVLGLVLGLLAPRAAAAVGEATASIGPVILWGLVLLIGLPIVAVLAMVTLVGLPFGLGLLLALGLIYAIGYTAGAWVLGRRVARGASPIPAFLAGWGILRALALVPFLGVLAWLAATFVGFGAIVMAGRRARRPVLASDEPVEAMPPRPSDPPPTPAPS